MKGYAIGAAVAVGVIAAVAARAAPEAPLDEIKAYCLDFNWGSGEVEGEKKINNWARPGEWADADPAQHVAWYKALGANVIQTFVVSCNGYAWYKNGVVPEQPGLKHDFLPEVVRLGHKEGMRVFGYFCAGANSRWAKEHPEQSYGRSSTQHIPYTDEYLTYLDKAIRDAVAKTGLDGFMVDWLFQPNRGATKGKWLDCEKRLYAQLMVQEFPGEDKLTKEQEIEYGRKAIARAWRTIHSAAKETNPKCLIWLTTHNPLNPHAAGSQMYKEVDWMMNEAGDIERVMAMMPMVGKHTRMVTCLALWNQQDPTLIVPAALKAGIGLYGFGKPGADSLLPLPDMTKPVRSLRGDERNLAALSRAYLGVPLDSVRNEKGEFVVPPLDSQARAPAIDQVVFGDRHSERAHALETTGKVPVKKLSTEIGSLMETYTARQCGGRDASITVACALPAAAADLPPFVVLEVEEIHERQWQTFGYSVLVNGKEVYFRTYEELAAGPNHYFVRIDRALIPDPGRIVLTFRNRGASAFRLARLWLYADFFGLAEREQVFQPMAILWPGPFGEPGRWKDFRLGYFAAATSMSYPYERKYAPYLDRGLDVISQKGVPSQLTLTSFFCGAPEGPDGQGGFFSDPKYGSTHYMRGKLYPDYPNPWSSAAGSPSLVEPVINKYLDGTREDACRRVQRQRDFQKAKGLATPPLSLCSDVGPGYAEDGDFSDFARAAAKADGVRLDPDNLTPEARLWMFRSVAGYFGRIAAAFRRGVGRDSVLVDRGTVTLPADQLSENLYNHPWWSYPYPAGDTRWVNWQAGIAPGVWSSGEMGPEVRASYDYVISQGKLAKVNQYDPFGRAADYFPFLAGSQYELGFLFSAMYDASATNLPGILDALDGIGNAPALPAVHCERKLLEVFIGGTERLGSRDQVVETVNVGIQRDSQLGAGLAPLDPGRPGSIMYALHSDEESAGPATLFLDVVGAIGKFDIAVGQALDRMIPAGTLDQGHFKDVGYLAHPPSWGGPVARLALPRMPDGSLPSLVKITFTRGFLKRVRVSIPWDRLAGHPADSAAPPPYDEATMRKNDDFWCWVSQHGQERAWTRKESRTLRLWVQQRRLTEMLLDQYRRLEGEDAVLNGAQTLYQQGLYANAYRRLIGEISQLLPARYAVRGHGTLGRYPVEVKMPSDNDVALITLEECSPERVVFTAEAEQAQSCTLKIGNLAKEKSYRLERISDTRYRLSRAGLWGGGANPVAAHGGTATLELVVGPETPKFPRKITGICVGRGTGTIHLWADDARMFGGVHEYHFKLAPDAVMKRREAHATTWNKGISGGGDLCTAELNERNEITVLESVYGTETGVIQSYEGPTFTADGHAGVITLDNGHQYELLWGGRYKSALDTALLQAGAPRVYNLDMLASGLRPGQRVEIAYTPSPRPDRPARILGLKQPSTVIFEDLFDRGEEAWQSKAVEAVNLRYYWWEALKGPALTPKSSDPGGFLVYKIVSPTPLGDTAVHVQGRVIIDPRCQMDFFTSPDGKTWTQRGHIQGDEQLSAKHMMANLTEGARGRTEFFLKIQLKGIAGWCTLHNVRVRTATP